jgi:uncharacterized phage-associated protein
MHKPLAVANRILWLAQDSEDPDITPMQLIKLVYLSHGWMLGLYGRPLLDESVEAWRYGPVIRSVYNAVSRFRDKPVEYPLRQMFGGQPEERFDDKEESVLKQVLDLYGPLDGISLSRLTHQRGSPWYQTWHSEGQNATISNDLIEHHFRDLYQESVAEETADIDISGLPVSPGSGVWLQAGDVATPLATPEATEWGEAAAEPEDEENAGREEAPRADG